MPVCRYARRMPACRHAGMPVCRCAHVPGRYDMPVCLPYQYASMPVCQYAGMPVCQHSGMPRYAGIPLCRYAGMPVCHAGMLVPDWKTRLKPMNPKQGYLCRVHPMSSPTFVNGFKCLVQFQPMLIPSHCPKPSPPHTTPQTLIWRYVEPVV